jgi:hypothetical protein
VLALFADTTSGPFVGNEREPRIARFRHLAAQAAGDSAAATRQASESLRLQPGQPQCMAVLETVTPARTR